MNNSARNLFILGASVLASVWLVIASLPLWLHSTTWSSAVLQCVHDIIVVVGVAAFWLAMYGAKKLLREESLRPWRLIAPFAVLDIIAVAVAAITTLRT